MGLVSCLLFTGNAYSESLLPFLGGNTNAKIELKGNDALKKILADEMKRQRKTNYELKTYTQFSKKTHLEKRLIEKRLRAEGYYRAKVFIDRMEKSALYRVLPGPQYRVSRVELRHPEHIKLNVDDLDIIKKDAPLNANEVLRSKARISHDVGVKNCLFTIRTDYKVRLFHSKQSAEVLFTIDDSPQVSYGHIRFSGNKTIAESYLLDRLKIRRGACFKRKDIDDARLVLLQTNLLASIDVQVMPPKNNESDLIFNVKERHHKTLSLGAGYDNDDGFGVLFGWEHRNIAKRAQKLDITLRAAEHAQSFESRLVLPHVKRQKQHAFAFARAENQDRDAYQSKAATLGVGVSRQLHRYLRGSLGLEWAFSRVIEDDEKTDFALISTPLLLEHDRRSDPLDPRKGWVVTATWRPYWDAYDDNVRFTKSSIAASVYHQLDGIPWRPTLAFRAATGAISGVERDTVPANLRYYVGGGGSVRGYTFQTLGPITDSEPDGGLSFNEYAAESRFYWGESWGGVVFIDGGFAYKNATPTLGEDLLWSAGLGLRFYTSFAPIRFDIAFPLTRRSGIDDPFQLYISIGQAF